jgi:amino acid transporter
VVSGSVPLATYSLDFIDPKLADNVVLCSALGSVWFLAIAAILISGISVTSWLQMAMTLFELVILTVVGAAAIWHGMRYGVATPFHWSWFGFGYSPTQFAASALIVVFFYWGWDVTANLAEETKNAEHYAGNGGFVSVFVTIAYYIAFVFAVLFLYSIKDAQKFDANIIYNIAVTAGLGRTGGLLASVAIILSSVANLETTMLGFSRTLFAMSRDGAMPTAFAKIHAGTRTPIRAMIVLIIFGLLLLWGSSLLPTVKTIIADSVRAVGVLVAYYYGLAGLVAARAFDGFRKTSFWKWMLYAVFPAASGVALIVLGVYAVTTFDLTTNVVAVGGLFAGIVFFRHRGWKFEEAAASPAALS